MPSGQLPKVPQGLRDLMKGLTKDILREKPSDLYDFSAQYFEAIVREQKDFTVKEFEPVSEYDFMKNRGERNSFSSALIYSIIPVGLTELIKDFIKAVLRQRPENICIFAVEYFRSLQKIKKNERIDYLTFEKSKEQLPFTPYVRCTCGGYKGIPSTITNNNNEGEFADKITNHENCAKNVEFSQLNVSEQTKNGKEVIVDGKSELIFDEKTIKAVYIIQKFCRRYIFKKRATQQNEQKKAEQPLCEQNGKDIHENEDYLHCLKNLKKETDSSVMKKIGETLPFENKMEIPLNGAKENGFVMSDSKENSNLNEVNDKLRGKESDKLKLIEKSISEFAESKNNSKEEKNTNQDNFNSKLLVVNGSIEGNSNLDNEVGWINPHLAGGLQEIIKNGQNSERIFVDTKTSDEKQELLAPTTKVPEKPAANAVKMDHENIEGIQNNIIPDIRPRNITEEQTAEAVLQSRFDQEMKVTKVDTNGSLLESNKQYLKTTSTDIEEIQDKEAGEKMERPKLMSKTNNIDKEQESSEKDSSELSLENQIESAVEKSQELTENSIKPTIQITSVEHLNNANNLEISNKTERESHQSQGGHSLETLNQNKVLKKDKSKLDEEINEIVEDSKGNDIKLDIENKKSSIQDKMVESVEQSGDSAQVGSASVKNIDSNEHNRNNHKVVDSNESQVDTSSDNETLHNRAIKDHFKTLEDTSVEETSDKTIGSFNDHEYGMARKKREVVNKVGSEEIAQADIEGLDNAADLKHNFVEQRANRVIESEDLKALKAELDETNDKENSSQTNFLKEVKMESKDEMNEKTVNEVETTEVIKEKEKFKSDQKTDAINGHDLNNSTEENLKTKDEKPAQVEFNETYERKNKKSDDDVMNESGKETSENKAEDEKSEKGSDEFDKHENENENNDIIQTGEIVDDADKTDQIKIRYQSKKDEKVDSSINYTLIKSDLEEINKSFDVAKHSVDNKVDVEDNVRAQFSGNNGHTLKEEKLNTKVTCDGSDKDNKDKSADYSEMAKSYEEVETKTVIAPDLLTKNVFEVQNIETNQNNAEVLPEFLSKDFFETQKHITEKDEQTHGEKDENNCNEATANQKEKYGVKNDVKQSSLEEVNEDKNKENKEREKDINQISLESSNIQATLKEDDGQTEKNQKDKTETATKNEKEIGEQEQDQMVKNNDDKKNIDKEKEKIEKVAINSEEKPTATQIEIIDKNQNVEIKIKDKEENQECKGLKPEHLNENHDKEGPVNVISSIKEPKLITEKEHRHSSLDGAHSEKDYENREENTHKTINRDTHIANEAKTLNAVDDNNQAKEKKLIILEESQKEELHELHNEQDEDARENKEKFALDSNKENTLKKLSSKSKEKQNHITDETNENKKSDEENSESAENHVLNNQEKNLDSKNNEVVENIEIKSNNKIHEISETKMVHTEEIVFHEDSAKHERENENQANKTEKVKMNLRTDELNEKTSVDTLVKSDASDENSNIEKENENSLKKLTELPAGEKIKDQHLFEIGNENETPFDLTTLSKNVTLNENTIKKTETDEGDIGNENSIKNGGQDSNSFVDHQTGAEINSNAENKHKITFLETPTEKKSSEVNNSNKEAVIGKQTAPKLTETKQTVSKSEANELLSRRDFKNFKQVNKDRGELNAKLNKFDNSESENLNPELTTKITRNKVTQKEKNQEKPVTKQARNKGHDQIKLFAADNVSDPKEACLVHETSKRKDNLESLEENLASSPSKKTLRVCQLEGIKNEYQEQKYIQYPIAEIYLKSFREPVEDKDMERRLEREHFTKNINYKSYLNVSPSELSNQETEFSDSLNEENFERDSLEVSSSKETDFEEDSLEMENIRHQYEQNNTKDNKTNVGSERMPTYFFGNTTPTESSAPEEPQSKQQTIKKAIAFVIPFERPNKVVLKDCRTTYDIINERTEKLSAQSNETFNEISDTNDDEIIVEEDNRLQTIFEQNEIESPREDKITELSSFKESNNSIAATSLDASSKLTTDESSMMEETSSKREDNDVLLPSNYEAIRTDLNTNEENDTLSFLSDNDSNTESSTFTTKDFDETVLSDENYSTRDDLEYACNSQKIKQLTGSDNTPRGGIYEIDPNSLNLALKSSENINNEEILKSVSGIEDQLVSEQPKIDINEVESFKDDNKSKNSRALLLESMDNDNNKKAIENGVNKAEIKNNYKEIATDNKGLEEVNYDYITEEDNRREKLNSGIIETEVQKTDTVISTKLEAELFKDNNTTFTEDKSVETENLTKVLKNVQNVVNIVNNKENDKLQDDSVEVYKTAEITIEEKIYPEENVKDMDAEAKKYSEILLPQNHNSFEDNIGAETESSKQLLKQVKSDDFNEKTVIEEANFPKKEKQNFYSINDSNKGVPKSIETTVDIGDNEIKRFKNDTELKYQNIAKEASFENYVRNMEANEDHNATNGLSFENKNPLDDNFKTTQNFILENNKNTQLQLILSDEEQTANNEFTIGTIENDIYEVQKDAKKLKKVLTSEDRDAGYEFTEKYLSELISDTDRLNQILDSELKTASNESGNDNLIPTVSAIDEMLEYDDQHIGYEKSLEATNNFIVEIEEKTEGLQKPSIEELKNNFDEFKIDTGETKKLLSNESKRTNDESGFNHISSSKPVEGSILEDKIVESTKKSSEIKTQDQTYRTEAKSHETEPHLTTNEDKVETKVRHTTSGGTNTLFETGIETLEKSAGENNLVITKNCENLKRVKSESFSKPTSHKEESEDIDFSKEINIEIIETSEMESLDISEDLTISSEGRNSETSTSELITVIEKLQDAPAPPQQSPLSDNGVVQVTKSKETALDSFSSLHATSNIDAQEVNWFVGEELIVSKNIAPQLNSLDLINPLDQHQDQNLRQAPQTNPVNIGFERNDEVANILLIDKEYSSNELSSKEKIVSALKKSPDSNHIGSLKKKTSSIEEYIKAIQSSEECAVENEKQNENEIYLSDIKFSKEKEAISKTSNITDKATLQGSKEGKSPNQNGTAIEDSKEGKCLSPLVIETAAPQGSDVDKSLRYNDTDANIKIIENRKESESQSQHTNETEASQNSEDDRSPRHNDTGPNKKTIEEPVEIKSQNQHVNETEASNGLEGEKSSSDTDVLKESKSQSQHANETEASKFSEDDKSQNHTDANKKAMEELEEIKSQNQHANEAKTLQGSEDNKSKNHNKNENLSANSKAFEEREKAIIEMLKVTENLVKTPEKLFEGQSNNNNKQFVEDIAITKMDDTNCIVLTESFLQSEILYNSTVVCREVVEEICIKKSVSQTTINEIDDEPELKANDNDSSNEASSSDVDLNLPTTGEFVQKMQKRLSIELDAAPHNKNKSFEQASFDNPVIKTMDSIVDSRDSSAGDTDEVVIMKTGTPQESFEFDPKTTLKRLHTIAVDDPKLLFKSVTIDETVKYIELTTESDNTPTSTGSLCLDEDTSENIRKKMMAYSLSEADSDLYEPKGVSFDVPHDDFDINTVFEETETTSTETESTIVSAATKIQAGARGFLTRRRMRRLDTKSQVFDGTRDSFGNNAISESLETMVENAAAKKIQKAYRNHRQNVVNSIKNSTKNMSHQNSLAAKRLTLQRGDALRNNSSPEEEESNLENIKVAETKNSLTEQPNGAESSKGHIPLKEQATASKSKSNELKWLGMRQNSMPVQIDCEVFRVIPKHMRKRISSAETTKKRGRRIHND